VRSLAVDRALGIAALAVACSDSQMGMPSSVSATSTASGGGVGGGAGIEDSGSAGALEGGPIEAEVDAPPEDASDAGAPLAPAGGTCVPGATYGPPLPENNRATLIQGGFDWLEGPVWIASQGALYFTEHTGTGTTGRIHKYTPANGAIVTFVDNVGTNGLAIDVDGRIVATKHDEQRLVRYDPATAALSPVAGGDTYMGSPYNMVNDVVVRIDGNMYFTDPDYQRGGRPGQNATASYRLSPQGVVTRIASSNEPNGIALSPDGKWLYVASTGGDPLVRYAIAADGAVTGAPTTLSPLASDGMAVDCAGNLYLASSGSIAVLDSSGRRIGAITGFVGATASNSAFGGDDRKTLYITTSSSLYQIPLNVPGFPN
jgi:gluconolactonase